MSIFSRQDRRHLVPLHRDNVRSKDWIILLEANTIVGSLHESFRVARATQQRRVVRRLRSLRRQLFLVVEGYDAASTRCSFARSSTNMTRTARWCRCEARRSESS